jgi:serine phosphatase RsbU (regulator of sigma subunit)
MENVLSELDAFTEGAPAEDDVTLVIVRRTD